MRPLRWTERAVAHLEALVDYISITSPVYTEGVVGRIDHRLQLVRANPELGRIVPEAGELEVREVVGSPPREEWSSKVEFSRTLRRRGSHEEIRICRQPNHCE